MTWELSSGGWKWPEERGGCLCIPVCNFVQSQLSILLCEPTNLSAAVTIVSWVVLFLLPKPLYLMVMKMDTMIFQCTGETVLQKKWTEGTLKYSGVRGNLIDTGCTHGSHLSKLQPAWEPEGPPHMLLLTELILVQLIQVEEEKVKDQFSSVAQSCLTLWDPMNRSMPGLPVHHQLPEFI